MNKEVKPYTLNFKGYTWDEYFYVIAGKSGILVAYRGGIDKEGAIKLDEIIYVDEADELSTLYESRLFTEARNTISEKDRLFFSYAEIEPKHRELITRALKNSLIPGLIKDNKLLNVRLSCIGACALFPKELLQEI